MGNSPSNSASVEYENGLHSHRPEGATGDVSPRQLFNPFDLQEGGSHARVNFPPFSDVIMQYEGPESGPSIDTLASMYPIDFPLR